MKIPLALLFATWLLSGRLQANEEVIDIAITTTTAAVVTIQKNVPVGGLMMESMGLLQEEDRSLHFQYRLMNSERHITAMQQGKKICSGGNTASERRDAVGYFVPFLIIRPMHLVVREEDVSRLPIIDGRVVVDKIHSETNLIGGYSIGRTYPQEVRKLIDSLSSRGEVNGFTVRPEQLIPMLSHKRFDFTFEYLAPTEFQKLNGYLPSKIASIPISEAQDFSISGIYCPRTEWGYITSRKIDAAVAKFAKNKPAIRAYYGKAIGADSYQIYEPQILQYYSQRQGFRDH